MLNRRALAGLMAAVVLSLPFVLRMMTDGSGGLAYVVSESMEPTLLVGDGFVLIPAATLQVGDVITFYPVTLAAERVTHRIIQLTPQGYVTQGDNNPDTDQAVGEPPVAIERISGKAWAWGGAVVRIPHLGLISQTLKDLLGKHLAKTIGLLLGLGALLVLLDLLRPTRHRRSRIRWRVAHLYGLAASGAIIVLIISLMLSSRVHSITYLASENPGDVANHVPVGQPGLVRLSVSNMGLLPVHHFSQGVGSVTVAHSPQAIGARSKEVVVVETTPHDHPGWYRAYVRVFHFPPLLPRPVVAWLFGISPDLAMIGLVAALAAALGLVVPFINMWTPLKAHGGTSFAIGLRRLTKRPAPRRRTL